jgi:hypothetical protein
MAILSFVFIILFVKNKKGLPLWQAPDICFSPIHNTISAYLKGKSYDGACVVVGSYLRRQRYKNFENKKSKTIS